jgi:signal transduction histidine kinase
MESNARTESQRTSQARRFRRGLARTHLEALRLLPSPWLVADCRTGAVVAVNRPFELLVGAGEAGLDGCDIAMITCEAEVSGWSLKALDLEMIGRPGLYEDVGLKGADGTPSPVDILVSHPPLLSTHPVAFCLLSDRSAHRRLEGELIAKHKELRRAFTDLERKSTELASAQETLKRKNRELGILSIELNRSAELAAIGEVTAELAHQLSNPLAAAVGATRQLEKLADQSGVTVNAAALGLLRKSLDRLTDTMAELRRLYRSSRPEDKPVIPFDLAPQVDGAIAILQQRLEWSQLLVEIPAGLPRIMGRPSHIQHVIVNLLENAVEAAGKGGTVALRAERAEDIVVFSVEDSGPGVPAHLKDRIFEPFYTTRPLGAGLGLALVRRNLDADGATIRVDRSAHGGAAFRIEFPAVVGGEELR